MDWDLASFLAGAITGAGGLSLVIMVFCRGKDKDYHDEHSDLHL